ncbi:hypothetical protein Rhopal_003916-T1 [Rhodotorula paludigena]|uniref:Deacetylase sirtuin-type domain-containing protein n=1 Tax=Rhodotorula paludigena TaxID=86838 RepID=A0AAV5GN34_9BASI|nr:hypothetical protein Rhopal_003916-T1 [Rhodotorula paludigena]
MLSVPLDPDSALEALAVVAVHLAASRHIVGALGAGVSTSAGIPDFRGARGGLYGARSAASLTSDLSTTRDPQLAAFSTSATKHLFSYAALVQPESRRQHLQLLAALKKHVRRATRPSKPSRKGKERAEPLAAECPTAFHGLLKSLEERGQLLRVYSQNIDGLERAAGLSAVDLVTPGGDGDGGVSGDESSSDYERSHASTSPKRRSPARAGPSQRVERAAHEHDGTVVALHGTLEEVMCGVCGWREKWRKEHTRSFRKGKTVDCSQCYERAASRRRRSKRMIRPSPLAFLRPAVLLYDDPHSFASSASSRISSIASADLTAAPDLLLVAGSSLKIPGFKRLVKEFAKRVNANGGLCVLVNREPVGKEWDGVFDYHRELALCS